MKELLFERPATIYIVLGAVEVVVLAVWARRRTARCAWAALAAPVLAVVVGLIAHYVQSDGEKIAAILDGAIAHVEAGEVDAAAECLDSKFAATDLRGRPVPKGRYVENARRKLRAWPVERIVLLRRETEVSGDSAVTELDTRIIGRKPGEGVPKATWELTWIRRREGWRVTAIKGVAPQWLVGLLMIS